MAHDEKNEAHGAHDAHIAHTMEPGMLIGVWLALMFFTVLTVSCAQLGLGSQASFAIAMVIATIKAALVMLIFMHLWWDKRLNLFVFLGCFLFVMLFIGMLITDKSEYKPDVDRKIADEAALSGSK